MAQAKDAPNSEESKKEEKGGEQPKPESKEEGKKDAKAGDILGGKKKESEEVKMVPEAVLIEMKKENKQMAKDMADLKTLIEKGASKKEVTSDLKALAEKHNVDPDFLSEFADAVRKEATEAAKAELKPIEEENNASKRESIFNEHYEKTLKENPEYAKLVNKDVIKALAFDPKNKDKTFLDIFESAYGHLVTGKKTIDTTKPRGGKEDTKVDISRAQRDPDYFKEVMADPELKKQYNEGLSSRIPI